MKQLKPIPFKVIIAATHGDEVALQYVIDHYKRYICALSTKTATDQNGNPHTILDEYMKAHLENKLIYSIVVTFKLPKND